MEERGVQRVNSMFDTHPRWLSSSKAVAIRVITRLVAVQYTATILFCPFGGWFGWLCGQCAIVLHCMTPISPWFGVETGDSDGRSC